MFLYLETQGLGRNWSWLFTRRGRFVGEFLRRRWTVDQWTSHMMDCHQTPVEIHYFINKDWSFKVLQDINIYIFYFEIDILTQLINIFISNPEWWDNVLLRRTRQLGWLHHVFILNYLLWSKALKLLFLKNILINDWLNIKILS